MCGIAGIVGLGRGTAEPMLKKMAVSLYHRGPDGEGFFFGNSVALGHRRLKIIDLTDAGKQPMANEDGTLLLVFNGEIYNFISLRESLKERGHIFKSRSDAEVVLHLYEDLGNSCVDELEGMFAFAIWDSKKNSLFAVRDRLGEKPLYYHFNRAKTLFVFSSEIGAILASGLVKRELNPEGVRSYFSYGSVQEPFTIIRGIEALSPGHILTYKGGDIQITRYWQIPLNNEPEESSKERIVEGVRDLLNNIVKRRLISDVPIGVFLSGGIDSSSIAALAAENSEQPIKTFSIIFKERAYDESRYSQLIAKRHRTIHRELSLRADDVLDHLEDVIRAMDQPTFDGINTYFISKMAKEAGLKVALSGIGGDELFGGYSTFRDLPRLYKIMRLWRNIPSKTRHQLLRLFKKQEAGTGGYSKIFTVFQYSNDYQDLYRVSRRLFLEDYQKKLFAGDFLAQVGAEKDMAEKEGGHDNSDPVNLLSHLELENYLKNTLLRDADMMSMAHPLEIRAPFLDHRLIEYMFRIPGELKVSQRMPKPLLVKGLSDLLPKAIWQRKKMGFTFPLERWLKHELRPLLKSVVSEKDTKGTTILNYDEVSTLVDGFLDGRKNTNWTRVWAILVFKLWCKDKAVV